MIQTVKGPIDASQLGLTLMHEHLFTYSPEVHDHFPCVWDTKASVAEAVRQLKQAASLGVQSFVDATVAGLGRNMELIRRVAEQVPLNIIVATGFYTFNELPHYFQNRDMDHMAGLFVRDIQEGIGDTGIRPALLKCVTEEIGVTPGVEKVLRAVARAQKQTGVPIYTHSHAGSQRGLDQQRTFQEEGVDLSRVVIGHAGNTDDLGYLVKLIDNGSYIGMDQFAYDVLFPFEKRISTVAELCRRGYSGRIILSHDWYVYTDWVPMDSLPPVSPDQGFATLLKKGIPALRQAGVSEGQINRMLVENPRKVFEGGGV